MIFRTDPFSDTQSFLSSPISLSVLYSGLRFHTALHLSRCNPLRLIITSRNSAAGLKAINTITKANADPVTGLLRQGCTIPEFGRLDLANLKDTKDFGERCGRELERLDIVVSRLNCLIRGRRCCCLRFQDERSRHF